MARNPLPRAGNDRIPPVRRRYPLPFFERAAAAFAAVIALSTLVAFPLALGRAGVSYATASMTQAILVCVAEGVCAVGAVISAMCALGVVDDPLRGNNNQPPLMEIPVPPEEAHQVAWGIPIGVARQATVEEIGRARVLQGIAVEVERPATGVGAPIADGQLGAVDENPLRRR